MPVPQPDPEANEGPGLGADHRVDPDEPRAWDCRQERLEDVRDLFAFMKTLPAVSTPSEPHQLSFPFNIRRTLGMWKLFYLDGRAYENSPARSAQLNRGGYLIEGPGHCAECHSSLRVSATYWLGSFGVSPSAGPSAKPRSTCPQARSAVGPLSSPDCGWPSSWLRSQESSAAW